MMWWIRGFPASIWQAARDGNSKAVEVFVQKGVEINSLDKKGRTPLDHAVLGKNKKLVKDMRNLGAVRASKLPKPKVTSTSRQKRIASTD